MTTRQTPDAVREAVATLRNEARRNREEATMDDRAADITKNPDAEPFFRSTAIVKRERADAIDAVLAALDSRAGDAGEKCNGGRCLDCDDTGDVHRVDGEWLGTCHCPAGTFSNPSTFGKPTFGVAATPAPAVDAEEGDDEGPCTDCGDTGITIQTERACSCDAGDQYRAPAVDAVPAGEVRKMVETLRGEMAAAPKRDWYPVHRDYLDTILSAALSHGEGRK